MSIQDEVSRLNAAKSGLAGAITAKGVTVPGTTKLDGYAALVEQIEAGGGGGAYDITATDNGDGTQSLAIADAAGGGGQTYTVTMPGKFTQEASAGEFVTYFDTDYSVTTTGIKTATTNQVVPYRSTFAVRTFVMPAEDVVISFE